MRVYTGVDVVFDAGAPEVMRGTACHAVRDARPVPDLLEVAEAGAAMAVLGEARRAAVSAREDEWAIRATPSLVALDHRHQFGGGLGINRNLERALRLVQLPAQRQGAFGLGVVAPLEPAGGPDAGRNPGGWTFRPPVVARCRGDRGARDASS